MRNSLWLLGLLLLLLPASTPRAAFISLESPVPGLMMMISWDAVFIAPDGGDRLGSLDGQPVAFGPDVIGLTGTEFLEGRVLDDPSSFPAFPDTAPTVYIGGGSLGAGTTTREATAFGTLTVSWSELLTGSITLEKDPEVTGFLDSKLQPIREITPRILGAMQAPAALGLIGLGLAGVWRLRRSDAVK